MPHDSSFRMPGLPSTEHRPARALGFCDDFQLTGYDDPRRNTERVVGYEPYAPAPLYWIWDLAIYGTLAGLLVLKGPVGRVSQRAAALAIFFGIVALGVAFSLLNFIEGHYDLCTPQRCALPLLPIIAFVAIRAMRTRGVLAVRIALPALAVIAQLVNGQFRIPGFRFPAKATGPAAAGLGAILRAC
jgi:hypothetical protein